MKEVIRFPGGIEGDVTVELHHQYNCIVITFSCENGVEAKIALSVGDAQELSEKLSEVVRGTDRRDTT